MAERWSTEALKMISEQSHWADRHQELFGEPSGRHRDSSWDPCLQSNAQRAGKDEEAFRTLAARATKHRRAHPTAGSSIHPNRVCRRDGEGQEVGHPLESYWSPDAVPTH